MKKTVVIMLCVLLCLVSLSACNTGAAQSPSSASESVSSSSASSESEASESKESEPEESSEAQAGGGHVPLLRLGTTNTNDGFNATSQSGILGRINYTGFCQGNMFVRDEKGDLVTSMLKSYEISDDNQTLTLVIPTNAVWHDGEPVTIEDLKFTFEYNRDVILSSSYQHFSNIEVQGDDTLVLTFDGELSAFTFINKIDTMSKIYPKHIWEKVEKPDEYMGDDRNIGCGPYKLVSIDTDAQISYYEAMPNYWKGELTVDEVSIKTYASQEALVMAMANGEVDAMYDYSKPISTNLYDTVEKSENLDLGMTQDPGNKMLMMGFRAAPTDDIHFRSAISYAIDYDMLALTVGGEYATVGTRGVIPSCNRGYNSGLEEMVTDYDKAAQMLDEAGYVDSDGDGWRELKDGTPIDLLIAPQNTSSQQEIMLRIGSILTDSFEQVGIKATFSEECLTNKETWSRIAEQEGSYNIHLGYCTSGMASFIGVPTYLLDSSINNWWGTCLEDDFINAYNQLSTAQNFDDFDKYMSEVQQVIADKVIAIPTCWETAAFPYRTDKYTGWTIHPGEGVIHANTWYNLRMK